MTSRRLRWPRLAAGPDARWVCAIGALAVCLLAVLGTIAVRQYRLTSLVRMSPLEAMAKIAREADEDFAFVHHEARYDGVYFYAMALDPLATGSAHYAIDAPAYRYGHPGYAWLTWLVSVGGRLISVPIALPMVALVCVAGAAYLASVLAGELGWSPWGGLFVAFNPGLIYAVTADTAEPAGALLLLAALLAWIRKRRWFACALIVGLCFVKEPLVLVPVGLGLWELISWLRHREGTFGDLLRRAALFIPGPVLYAGWILYIRVTFGAFPSQHGPDRVVTPMAGWRDALATAAGMGMESVDRMQIGSASLPLLVIALCALLFGLYRSLQFKSPIDAVFVTTGLLMLSVNIGAIVNPKDLMRNLAFTVLLLPSVVAMPRREAWREDRRPEPPEGAT